MRVSEIKIDGGHTVTLAEYDSPRDLLTQVKAARKLGARAESVSSAGDTVDGFERGMRGQNPAYVDAAKELVTQFGNIAVEEVDRTLDQNLVSGVLDYNAAMAGDPMCMFGATMGATDRSPVAIYVDPWVSGNVSAINVTRRGVAVLALVQALQMYRPVNVYLLKGSRFSPSNKDTVQVLPIPTSPMDLSRASYMMCSPATNRHGFLRAIHAVHQNGKYCPSFPMRASVWQREEMGKWLADKQGVGQHLYIPRMDNSKGFWSSDASMTEWLKARIAEYLN